MHSEIKSFKQLCTYGALHLLDGFVRRTCCMAAGLGGHGFADELSLPALAANCRIVLEIS